MSLNDAVSAFSAVSCWELALIFIALSLRMSRRPENAVFAILNFFLGSMIWCKLVLQHTVSREECVLWYRLHYLCVYAIVAVYIHFLILVARQPFPRFFSPRRVYEILGAFSLFVFSPQVVHLAPPRTPRPLIYSDTWGPLYPEYVAFIIIVGVAASANALAHLRQRAQRATGETPETGFSAFDRDLVLLIWTGVAVALAGGVELVQQVWLHEINVSVNPRAIAAVFSSAMTAWALLREMRRTEERWLALKLERGRADALAQARLQATYDMQHQIKNKLVAIELPLKNALRGFQQGTAPEVQQSRLSAALTEVRDLFHALDVMLNVARLGAGEPVHLGPKRAVDAAALVQAACLRRQQWERERRAAAFDASTWEFVCETDIQPPLVLLHADDLDHILTVLLDNAIRYSPQGGTIWMRLWSDGERLRLSIADKGIGISAQDLAHIGRRPFFRGRSGDRAGTGLGLYLARRLVEAQGGQFWAESAVGNGSVFHVSLPLEPAATG